MINIQCSQCSYHRLQFGTNVLMNEPLQCIWDVWLRARNVSLNLCSSVSGSKRQIVLVHISVKTRLSSCELCSVGMDNNRLTLVCYLTGLIVM